jgi:hypothetical protein
MIPSDFGFKLLCTRIPFVTVLEGLANADNFWCRPQSSSITTLPVNDHSSSQLEFNGKAAPKQQT